MPSSWKVYLKARLLRVPEGEGSRFRTVPLLMVEGDDGQKERVYLDELQQNTPLEIRPGLVVSVRHGFFASCRQDGVVVERYVVFVKSGVLMRPFGKGERIRYEREPTQVGRIFLLLKSKARWIPKCGEMPSDVMGEARVELEPKRRFRVGEFLTGQVAKQLAGASEVS